jgi:small nuclear ribonucleoprotein (snRNP)-like protein
VVVMVTFDLTFIASFSRSYLDKTIALQLNKGRKVSGTLRGYDQFMNLVLGDAVEEVSTSSRSNIGMVVSFVVALFFLIHNTTTLFFYQLTP